MILIKLPEPGTIQLIVVTALITGLLVGVFGKKLAELTLELILRPIRFVTEAVYRWIAPRNPFSISLRSYKKHVSRSKLTRIENPVGPNLSVPLEYAFAPLKLISSDTQETVDLFAKAAESHRCIVLGGPGTGKTTLMKSLVTSIINRRSHEALNDLVPVFVVLRNLAKKGQSVEQAIVSSFADYHFPGAEKFVASALSQGKMLIVLDGLDEVGASREYVAGEILSFCDSDDQQEHRSRVIVTCREYSYRTRDLQSAIGEIVRVEPFANHHMRVFLQGWPEHKGRMAMKLYGLIQNDQQLRDICRNPLLLTILTGLYLDTDNFALPTSRDRFYKAAVDELLLQRPARRQIKQTFDPEAKSQILERVALERLETAKQHEDPEEFSQAALQRKAGDVLGNEDIDFRELIKELVDINGIIKPGSEGNYTCAHRTIQEYFAAREARRTRETNEVIEMFGGRVELIEVLYFYCGLVHNIPALTSIVQAFINQGKWIEAGRCLLHTRDVLDAVLVSRIASELRNQISPAVDFKVVLELLSSLAQRQEPEFEAPRRLFSEAVDDLAEGYGEKGASALESALATSPEAAMKVIPSLLKHPSQRWKSAAVNLLRDIGTDEALDNLVQLLTHKDPFIKAEAGTILAGMMKSRNRDLRERSVLLPERRDPELWPLDNYFPSKLAIPMAEALESFEETGNSAIDCGVKVLRMRRENSQRENRRFRKHWMHLPRDLKFQKGRVILGSYLLYLAIGLSLLTFASLQLIGVVARERGQILILSARPLRIHPLGTDKLSGITNQARLIVDDITSRFPANASGWERLLPQNWQVEPEIPSRQLEALATVEEWTNHYRDPYNMVASSSSIHELSELHADSKLADLMAEIGSLNASLPDLQDASYIVINPSREGKWGVFALMISIPGLLVYSVHLLRKIRQYTNAKGGISESPWLQVMLIISVVFVAGVSSNLRGSVSLRSLPIITVLLILLVGLLLGKISWPRNQLISVIESVIPPLKLDEQLGVRSIRTSHPTRI